MVTNAGFSPNVSLIVISVNGATIIAVIQKVIVKRRKKNSIFTIYVIINYSFQNML